MTNGVDVGGEGKQAFSDLICMYGFVNACVNARLLDLGIFYSKLQVNSPKRVLNF